MEVAGNENLCVLNDLIPDMELTVPEYRDWVVDIEDQMINSERSLDRHSEDSPIKLRHTFTPGLYTREIFMPAGSLVVSRIHLHEHPFVIVQGRVSVYDGILINNITAPFMGITPAGTKRILYVHEDTTWATFHVTDKTTFEDIDEDGVITCGTFEEFEKIANKELIL